MGLRLDPPDAARGLRNVRFVGLTLFWGFVASPALAFAITRFLPIARPYAMGLLLIGITPSAPFLPMIERLRWPVPLNLLVHLCLPASGCAAHGNGGERARCRSGATFQLTIEALSKAVFIDPAMRDGAAEVARGVCRVAGSPDLIGRRRNALTCGRAAISRNTMGVSHVTILRKRAKGTCFTRAMSARWTSVWYPRNCGRYTPDQPSPARRRVRLRSLTGAIFPLGESGGDIPALSADGTKMGRPLFRPFRFKAARRRKCSARSRQAIRR